MAPPAAGLPVIDFGPLRASGAATTASADPAALDRLVTQLREAFTEWGAFVLVNGGTQQDTSEALMRESREFFGRPREEKERYSVAGGGLAWRGYMRVGGEYTHGRMDHKEGLYVGKEHGPDHARQVLPVHDCTLLPLRGLVRARQALRGGDVLEGGRRG